MTVLVVMMALLLGVVALSIIAMFIHDWLVENTQLDQAEAFQTMIFVPLSLGLLWALAEIIVLEFIN